jgi:peptide methionine sulfoxide reductase MsrB
MLKEKKNHHQPTTVRCWTSPIARQLARSSATRIQFPPAVLRKSSLHVYRDVVSTPELVYPSSCRFYGWYGQPTATSACTKNQKHILDDTKNRNNTITIESRKHYCHNGCWPSITARKPVVRPLGHTARLCGTTFTNLTLS